MSRVLHPEDWDPQNELYPMNPAEIWATRDAPAGWVNPMQPSIDSGEFERVAPDVRGSLSAKDHLTMAGGSEGSLAGQVALVTGSGRGLGADIAQHLAGVGASVVVSGRGENVEATAARIDGLGCAGEVMSCRLDVLRTADWSGAVDSILDRFGRIDILVNNAGGMIPGADLIDMTDDDWDYMLRVNVDGVFYGCRSVAPVMIRQASGTIVNISSIFGEQPQASYSAYCCSKAAVKALSQSLALELAPHNITVNALCPGYTESDMYRNAMKGLAEQMGSTVEEAKAQVLSMIPAGRVGSGDELGATIAFLASEGGRYFTAQSLIQGGGVLYK